MKSIAERMSSLAGGSRHNITDRMERPEREKEHSEEEHDGVPEHLKAMHEKMGGKHMHVHAHEGGGYTTHHIGEDGKVEGPHDHENTEELKDHMDRFLSEEEHEPAHESHDGLM